MTLFSLIIGFFCAFFIGFFLVSSFMKETQLSFRVLFALPVGFGLCSLLYFFSMVLNLYNFGFYRYFEFFVLICCGILYYFKNQQEPPKLPKFSIPFTLALSYGFLIYSRYFINNPMGSWDGFRIWNIKAQFLYQYDNLWRNVFLLPNFLMHNDYPLFIPCTVSRLWKFAHSDFADIANIVGITFTFCTVFLVYFTIKKYKNADLAAVVSSVLALCFIFLTNGASQSADIPMAYMALCAVVSLIMFFDKRENIYIVLGTIFAGLTIWTKNEGIMFLLVYAGVFSLYFLFKKEFRRFWLIVALALPFLAFLAFYKSMTETPNDLFYGIFLLKTYTQVFKYKTWLLIIKWILKFTFTSFVTLFPLFILTARGFEIDKKLKMPFFLVLLILILLACGYFAVYLLSPHDLVWLLQNSLERIMLHMTPIFVLALALCLKICQKDSAN